MDLTLLRNATLLLDAGDAAPVLLVDPMLNAAEAVGPVEGTAPELRNPRVELPLPVEEVVARTEAVLVTHLHNDHFDDAARAQLPLATPVLCQPADRDTLQDAGFTRLSAIDEEHAFDGGATLHRVVARHTLGDYAEALGPGSGYVLTGPGLPTTYVTGDSVWCEEVAETLERFRPAVVVVNAGAARFLTSSPITMSAEDVIAVCRHAPDATVVAVHLEALNHCPLTREELRRHAVAAGVDGRLAIPQDGETLSF